MNYKIILYIVLSTFLFSTELITPIPLTIKYDKNKVTLGKKLFYDTRLSHDNTVSCANCHIIEDGGDDNLRVSYGIKGKQGTRNSPTVLNSRYNIKQFWDGGAKDLQAQARGPIHNPVEMGSNFKEVINKLKQDKNYLKEFSSIYPDGITGANITDAIAKYEETLITPNCRFDQYLRGDDNAITSDEKAGYELFKDFGCISCHNGINIGGNIIQKMGVVKPIHSKDLGRYYITKKEEDKYYFKVPTLRNIDQTAPYFHDGRVKTLRQALNVMIQYQVGFDLSKKQIDLIIKFLKTLSAKPLKVEVNK